MIRVRGARKTGNVQGWDKDRVPETRTTQKTILVGRDLQCTNHRRPESCLQQKSLSGKDWGDRLRDGLGFGEKKFSDKIKEVSYMVIDSTNVHR